MALQFIFPLYIPKKLYNLKPLHIYIRKEITIWVYLYLLWSFTQALREIILYKYFNLKTIF